MLFAANSEYPQFLQLGFGMLLMVTVFHWRGHLTLDWVTNRRTVTPLHLEIWGDVLMF